MFKRESRREQKIPTKWDQVKKKQENWRSLSQAGEVSWDARVMMFLLLWRLRYFFVFFLIAAADFLFSLLSPVVFLNPKLNKN